MTCILREKGTYFGRVEDPTTAKFAPFVNEVPDKASKYGTNKLAFKLWPANVLERKHFQIEKYFDIKHETSILIPHHSAFTVSLAVFSHCLHLSLASKSYF